MRIIPAMDLIDGKCVRLEKGDYNKKKEYKADPVDVAKSFADHGLNYLHMVDLDGAKAGKVVNWKILERIAGATSLEIDFGGGIKSDEDVQIAFNSGAKQINVGSTAVKQKDLFLSWLERLGSEKVILSADVRDRKIAIHGWQTDTEIDLMGFVADYVKSGLQNVTTTDISKDGMLQGVATDLYQDLVREFPDLNIIASGGVSKIEDLEELTSVNVFGVIIGKAIYDGRIELKELQKFGDN